MQSLTLIGIRKCVSSAEFRIIEGRIMQVLLYFLERLEIFLFFGKKMKMKVIKNNFF